MINTTVGRYQIRATLGRGGMARVYRAHDPDFEREVAIKVLPSYHLRDPTFRIRFQQEAKIMASLEHYAIVPVYDVGEENGRPFIVMRLMDGASLKERISPNGMPLAEITRILGWVAPALDEAHKRGIIHRDLKPSNILFDQHNMPHIADFGIAKVTQSHLGLTSTNLVLGTPAYMSPEQTRPGAKVDGASDIYALGVILFEMLTGKVPYKSHDSLDVMYAHRHEPIPRLDNLRADLPARLSDDY